MRDLKEFEIEGTNLDNTLMAIVAPILAFSPLPIMAVGVFILLRIPHEAPRNIISIQERTGFIILIVGVSAYLGIQAAKEILTAFGFGRLQGLLRRTTNDHETAIASLNERVEMIEREVGIKTQVLNENQ